MNKIPEPGPPFFRIAIRVTLPKCACAPSVRSLRRQSAPARRPRSPVAWQRRSSRTKFFFSLPTFTIGRNGQHAQMLPIESGAFEGDGEIRQTEVARIVLRFQPLLVVV